MASVERAVGGDRRMWHRAGLIPSLMLAAAGIALAGVSASAALGNALARRAPEQAAQFWPQNGFAQGTVAANIVASAVRHSGQVGAAPLPRGVRDHARRALLAEPASVPALRSLALYHQSVGDDARARQLMRLSARLSSRDTVTNLWLVEDYLRAGDLDRATARIDAALRSDTSAKALLLPRLAQMLAVPEAQGFLRDMLASDPPWQHDFWSAVLQGDGVPDAAVSMRMALHRRGVGLALGHDARLIAALIEARQFEAAFALHAAARAADREGSAQFAPIDWRLVAGGDYGATLGSDGVLNVQALAGAQGVLAQKIVPLARGEYVLRANANADAGPGQLSLRLTCAELFGEDSFAQTFALTANTSATFTQPSACRYAWLTITLAQSPRDLSIAVQPISLRLAGGGA